MAFSPDDPFMEQQYRDVRVATNGLATLIEETNKRIILRADSEADAYTCKRILRHEGYICEARRGLRSNAMYLQVFLRY